MSDTSESKNPFNKWWFISGGLVLVIAAALVWILVIGPGTANNNNDALPEPGNSSSALPEKPTSSTKPTELAGGGECNLDDSDQEIPTVGPEADWIEYGPSKAPRSEAAGPAVQDGLVWSCFAHTPTGALFASAYAVWALAWNDYEAVVEKNVVPSPAVDAFLAARAEEPEATVKPGTAPGIGGFRFESYEGDTATVQIGLRYGTNERMARVFLVWDEEAGDWKIDLAKNDPSFITNEVTSIQNFTPWEEVYE